MLILADSKSRACAILVTAGALSGCYELDPSTVAQTPTPAICESIAVARVGNSDASTLQIGLDELKERHLFSAKDLSSIAAGTAYIGMSEAALVCLASGSIYGVNVTTTRYGTSKQYLLYDGEYVKRVYVYTTDGIVDGIQN